MTSAFSSNDSDVIERNVDTVTQEQSLPEIWNEARCSECSSWIKKNNFKKVCLQFPDSLIPFSIEITQELSRLVECEVYVLGDTSYGSCCIDEVAAAHIDADAIIHFGHACLSRVSRLPVFYVFPNLSIDPELLLNEINELQLLPSTHLLVFYDVGYYYSLDAIRAALISNPLIKIAKLAVNSEADLLSYDFSSIHLENISTCLYIGKDDQTFFNLNISLHDKTWYLYDLTSPGVTHLNKVDPLSSNWMKRRYYFIEKCKDAQSIGIVVATLTAKGYLDVVQHIQKLAKIRGIRSYLISVGKVNPAKLANFLDIDCFVLIGCPENKLIASRDFYKPLLSTFEVEVALNPVWRQQLPDRYFVEFKEVLPNGKFFRDFDELSVDESDVSLLSGKVRFNKSADRSNVDTDQTNALMKRDKFQLMELDSHTSFQHRSWTGLDPAVGQSSPVKIVEGRSGIAMKYDEVSTNQKK
ncbi:2-(3-amino-3-carboxypropyl)histidine synthase subunit 2 [Pseudolycoriella hygida]|uniref:2-(3-amino-3-carboxypropyl)histidine synthase subunit 2 n=1 Tax=Pseudolycoriella hygida TaxID=35572 RepID=A0A9Q0MNN8_9DIPT|nr:2-(3-amino-3-carboxypropyl)histidine synthase subunit 2 [Pseudolycoriella hygida]